MTTVTCSLSTVSSAAARVGVPSSPREPLVCVAVRHPEQLKPLRAAAWTGSPSFRGRRARTSLGHAAVACGPTLRHRSLRPISRRARDLRGRGHEHGAETGARERGVGAPASRPHPRLRHRRHPGSGSPYPRAGSATIVVRRRFPGAHHRPGVPVGPGDALFGHARRAQPDCSRRLPTHRGGRTLLTVSWSMAKAISACSPLRHWRPYL